MPDSANGGFITGFFTKAFETAVGRLGAFLHLPDYPPPRKLAEFELAQYCGRGAVVGWEIKPFNVGSPYSLRVFVDNRFPYVPPRVALYPVPPKLSYPHIENDGYLCLQLGETAVDHNAVEAVTEATLVRAVQLVEDSLAGKTMGDFHEEILSYWGRVTDAGSRDYYSLLDTSNHQPRKVCVWRGKVFRLVAENRDEAYRWLRNKFNEDNDWTFEEAAFVWLEGPLLPSQYPGTGIETYQLFRRAGPQARLLFEGMTADFPSEINAVVGTQTSSGPALLGMTLRKAKFDSPARISAKENFFRGFRQGSIPIAVAAQRYSGGEAELEKSDVQRVDPKWVLSRDADPNFSIVSDKTATIIGCGAVGSEIARLLVQSGITRLHLLDPDTMAWENIGRHALGASAMNFGKKRPKVSVLADDLRTRYPHIQIASQHAMRWEDAARIDDAFLNQTDLIIMATGEWSADNAMNDLSQAQERFPPVLYGWAEAFASAGHALAVMPNGGCLSCAFDNWKFKFQVTDFPEAVFQAAACGSVFQPFGAIDLAPITAMIAKTGLDILTGDISASRIRTWVGPESILKKRGGKWTDLWAPQIKSKGSTSFMKEIDLLPVAGCAQEHLEENKCDTQEQTASH